MVLRVLLKHMQDNNLTDNFHLVLFINDTSAEEDYITLGGNIRVPWLLGVLFGNPAPDGNGVVTVPGPMGLNADGMSPRVFNPAAWNNPVVWEPTAETGAKIRYFKLNVTTVTNNTWQIRAGQSGTVHIFLNSNPDSGAMPQDAGSAAIYGQVYSATRNAAKSSAVWEKLQEALGLE